MMVARKGALLSVQRIEIAARERTSIQQPKYCMPNVRMVGASCKERSRARCSQTHTWMTSIAPRPGLRRANAFSGLSSCCGPQYSCCTGCSRVCSAASCTRNIVTSSGHGVLECCIAAHEQARSSAHDEHLVISDPGTSLTYRLCPQSDTL